MTIAGYVLAGGGSRRFGPTDKARAELDGSTLIQRNAAVLAELYGDVHVVSAPGRNYTDLGLQTIFDEHPDQGPLAGLEAAMLHTTADAIAVAACDLAGLRPEWFALLEAVFDGQAAAFKTDRWQPLVAIYSVSLLPEITRRIEAGQLALRFLLEDFGTAVMPPADFGQLRSIDTPRGLT